MSIYFLFILVYWKCDKHVKASKEISHYRSEMLSQKCQKQAAPQPSLYSHQNDFLLLSSIA